MANLENIMSVSAGDIEKIMGVAKGSIEKVMGLELGDPTWQGSRAVSIGRQLSSGSGIPAPVVRYVQTLYRTISTSGSDAADFSDLDSWSVAAGHNKGLGEGPSSLASNSVHAVFWGGFESWKDTGGNFSDQGIVMTIASGSDAVFGTSGFDFASQYGGQACNAIVSHHIGGTSDTAGTEVATGHKLTIGTSGSASSSGSLVAVGSLVAARQGCPGISHSTYGYFCGGWLGNPAATIVNEIQKITIGSDSDATDQGDMTVVNAWASGSEDATRGINYCGWEWGGYKVDIGYFSTDSGGNASDFGDRSNSAVYGGAAGNGTICEFWGGTTSAGTGTFMTQIFYVTVQSTSNAIDTGQSSEWDSISFPSGGHSNRTGTAMCSLASGIS